MHLFTLTTLLVVCVVAVSLTEAQQKRGRGWQGQAWRRRQGRQGQQIGQSGQRGQSRQAEQRKQMRQNRQRGQNGRFWQRRTNKRNGTEQGKGFPARQPDLQTLFRQWVAIYRQWLDQQQHNSTTTPTPIFTTLQSISTTTPPTSQTTPAALTSTEPAKTPPPLPLLPTLASNLGLTTIVNLVTQAGLGTTLSRPGPFTVFAPSDAAFNASLFQDAISNPHMNTSDLATLLAYHVLPLATFSTSLQNELLATSVQGAHIRINSYPSTTGAITAQCQPINVTLVDNEADNGVLHVLEGVMTPPTGTIMAAASTSQGLGTFTYTVEAGNLTTKLSGPGPFTVFAPTDDAFNMVPALVLNEILGNFTTLQEVLLYHVVPGTHCTAGITSGPMTTLTGADLDVVVAPGVSVNGATVNGATVNGATVNGATVLQPDVSVTNGVMHVIDQVLIPPHLVNTLMDLI